MLYLVPSKALVNEVTTSLNRAFTNTAYRCVAISAQIVEFADREASIVEAADVLVLTPEKADLLLRIGDQNLGSLSLVVIDEAHHIESQTRGALLEMYLWRLRAKMGLSVRLVFLSAVAPNILSVAGAMGTNSSGVVVHNRGTRMRVGVFRHRGKGRNLEGWIDYSDGTSVCTAQSAVETKVRTGLAQLSERLSVAGPVLVVARGKSECENIAKEMLRWLQRAATPKSLTPDELASPAYQRLDARLEREMYADVPMRELVRGRIAYHHAGLPPSVRIAVEDAVRAGIIDFVFATTTLAEGVNFPFSSVIVQSLALREAPAKGRPTTYHLVTPRVFWNIAGRAGRPGFDREGQVILYEPTLGLDKVAAVLDDYLDPSMTAIAPVASAFASGLRRINADIASGTISRSDLGNTTLPAAASKEVHGSINLVRIGLVHARASNLLASPSDLLSGTFAATQLSPGERQECNALLSQQNTVIDDFLAAAPTFSEAMVAELGLSIETLTDLSAYVVALEDWQLSAMASVMRGGDSDTNQARYVIGPVCSRMSELEGTKLGGLYAEVVIQWLSGTPLSFVRPSTPKRKWWDRLEDLISVLYSRVQYLLPWGLYATDRLVENEARRRKINYSNEVRSLAYLVEAGVPNFDALRLVGLDFERADATRIASRYRQAGRRQGGPDIIGWLRSLPLADVELIVRGGDGRRVDFDLEFRLKDLRGSAN